jgi:L-fuconolactonase
MRIDAHQHFWRYNPDEYGWIDDSMCTLRRDFLPADLQPELAASGFDACVAVQARQTFEETRWLLQLADANPFIAGVVGWVDLRAENVRDQLAEFSKNPKLLGIRHIVQAEPDERFLLRADFLRGIASLEEFNLSYDILIYPRHLPVAIEFVQRFPRQRFVLDHLAKPFVKLQTIEPWASHIRQLAWFPNVFCSRGC